MTAILCRMRSITGVMDILEKVKSQILSWEQESKRRIPAPGSQRSASL